jgi:hypothetical protein
MSFVISEIENAIRQIERTVGMLRQSSCERWATELERHLDDVRGTAGFAQRQALFKIGELCHPKALGDANVSDAGWQAQLQTLHDVCARAFNKLETGVA